MTICEIIGSFLKSVKDTKDRERIEKFFLTKETNEHN